MATTTIFDVVKVSELPVVQRLTEGDHFIVNDRDPSTGSLSSKTILVDDLAITTAERTTLKELKDVVVTSPKSGQVLRWAGSNWINSDESSLSIILTDLSVRNLPVNFTAKGGKLEYDSRVGLFSYSPSDINGPISNHHNVSPLADTPIDRDTLSWSGSSNQWEPSRAIEITTLNLPAQSLNNKGKIEANGYRIDYTPPDLSGYLLKQEFVEQDPVFRGSVAYTIGGAQLSNWDQAYSWGNHNYAGYLKQISIKEINDVRADDPINGDGLVFNKSVNLWISGHPVIKALTRIDDVEVTAPQDEQVLTYETRSGKWKNKNNIDTLDYTNVPVLTGIVASDGSKISGSGRESHNFSVNKLASSQYELILSKPLLNLNYVVSVTTNSTASGVCVATVISKALDKVVVQTANLSPTAINNDASFQFTVTV